MALSKTAANRVVTEDFGVPDLMEKVDELTSELEVSNDALVDANNDYDDAARLLADAKDILIDRVTTAARRENSKVSQTAIDGQIKLALASDSHIDHLETRLADAKTTRISAQRDADNAKAAHRAHLAKMNLSAASLQFLGLSKSARATALELLREL